MSRRTKRHYKKTKTQPIHGFTEPDPTVSEVRLGKPKSPINKTKDPPLNKPCTKRRGN